MPSFKFPLRKKRYTTLFFLRALVYKFSSTFIKNRVVVEFKKTQTRNSSVLLWHFEIPIYFWFQWMSLSNLFLIKLWKFLVMYLSCGCMTFNFTTQMTSSHLLPPVSENKKLECKDHQIYSETLRKICKKEVFRFNFINVIKNSSLN